MKRILGFVLLITCCVELCGCDFIATKSVKETSQSELIVDETEATEVSIKPSKIESIVDETKVTEETTDEMTTVDSVEIPDLRGCNEDEAKSELDELGIEYKITEIHSEKEEPGTVVNVVGSGTKYIKGESEPVSVFINSCDISVPISNGMLEWAAVEKLEAGGFKYNIEYVYSESNKDGGLVKDYEPEWVDDLDEVVTLKIAEDPLDITGITFETDLVGGVSTHINFQNTSGKKINYITFTFVYFNAIGDKVYDSISGDWDRDVKYTGPLEGGGSISMVTTTKFYNYNVSCVSWDRAVIEFSDGTTTTFTNETHHYWYHGNSPDYLDWDW